jgi:hypothetical protein
MSALNRLGAITSHAVLVARLMLVVPCWAEAQAGAANAVGKAHVRPGHSVVFPQKAPRADQDLWGTTGSPWGYVRRLPPPTPESHIQPRYRDASTIRPEFVERDRAVPP